MGGSGDGPRGCKDDCRGQLRYSCTLLSPALSIMRLPAVAAEGPPRALFPSVRGGATAAATAAASGTGVGLRAQGTLTASSSSGYGWTLLQSPESLPQWSIPVPQSARATPASSPELLQ